jgi:3-deoxy-7-phosphoheptulonate synthase
MTARTALQQPKYDDPSMLAAVVEDLSSRQPLVEPDTIDRLLAKLARVADGEAFVLQAGYCAETFRTSQRGFVRLIKVIFQMALILMHGSGVEVIKILRGAGQFGKPRSSAIGSDGLPVFRGDIINGAGATQKARRHDPKRLTRAYNESRRILEMLSQPASWEVSGVFTPGISSSSRPALRACHTKISPALLTTR